MASESNFLLNLSILNRNIQKYFDKTLSRYGIGYGQIMFLLEVNEQEGITMQELSRVEEVDKGTTTKGMQKLIETGYVQQVQDPLDHRVKRLYTTPKAAEIMSSVYDLRNECRSRLGTDIDLTEFEKILEQVAGNSREYLNPQPVYSGIKIGGMQKMTLLDYPDKVACTVFTGGCNFKCPFCHNKDLVFLPDDYEFFDPEEVLSYLQKRKGILDGVCISGGEPLIQDGLEDFIRAIKDLGYLVKLDTNGFYPERLIKICGTGMVDYVAMDLKNCPDKYAITCGMNPDVFDLSRIQESVKWLKEDHVDHEFRTTVVRELHAEEDLVEIAKWIQGEKKYYLQQYQDSGNVIHPGWTAYSESEMNELKRAVSAYVPDVQLRGIKEG